MANVAQYFKQVREARGGIVGRVILLTACIIAVCAYFGIDLRAFIDSSGVQETVGVVREFIKSMGEFF